MRLINQVLKIVAILTALAWAAYALMFVYGHFFVQPYVVPHSERSLALDVAFTLTILAVTLTGILFWVGVAWVVVKVFRQAINAE